MTDYPEASGDAVQYAAPSYFTRVYMAPDQFLALCPPMGGGYDPEADAYIQTFVQHIKDGLPLDPPEWSLQHHDGRHRAHAAKIAGVRYLPVMVADDLVDWLMEMEFAT